MGAIPLHGQVGAIHWQYATAATLRDFVVAYNPETRTWALHGTVTSHDPFKLRQQPLVFVARASTGLVLRWQVLDVGACTGGRLTAHVVPERDS